MRLPMMPTILPAALALVLILAPAASAKLEVELDVEKVSEHAVLVTLTWEARIQSDRDWDGCELVISFRDPRDREIHRITKTMSLRKGLNRVSGHEICESSTWERTRKFSGKLNCGF
jgi:hypothetical protein